MMSSSLRGHVRGFVILSLIAGAIGVHAACIVADPPSDLPRLPESRPTILRASVVPSASAVIGTWPDRFIVPVELSDPRSTIWWSAFVDYNPDTGFGLDGLPTQSSFEPTTTQGRVRLLEIPIGKPAALDRCHVVEVVVALNLNTRDPKSAHTPDEPGGDIVSWFYSPSGDLAGCPVLDAGLSPIDLDATSDGNVR